MFGKTPKRNRSTRNKQRNLTKEQHRRIPQIMYKPKNPLVPSDAQAREKLALYVYEYLMFVGAQKAAQTFLAEIRWEKNIKLGEPPGFLDSWWCVFWDLYCAAPGRRDHLSHSATSKAFHDFGNHMSSVYNVNDINTMEPQMQRPHYASPGGAHNPMGQQPPNNGMSNGSIPPNATVRPSPPTSKQALTTMLNSRLSGPRPSIVPPMYGMRGPPPHVMPPGMARPTRPQWQPNTSMPMSLPNSCNYSSSSPGNFAAAGQRPPVMSSPQHSSNSGADNMHAMMKKPEGNMCGIKQEFDHEFKQEFKQEFEQDFEEFDQDFKHEFKQEFPDSSGDENAMANNLNNTKNGTSNGNPSTSREDGNSGIGDYNLNNFNGHGENNPNESAAILQIKKSMQEEAKRFEKDSDSPDFFMP